MNIRNISRLTDVFLGLVKLKYDCMVLRFIFGFLPLFFKPLDLKHKNCIYSQWLRIPWEQKFPSGLIKRQQKQSTLNVFFTACFFQDCLCFSLNSLGSLLLRTVFLTQCNVFQDNVLNLQELGFLFKLQDVDWMLWSLLSVMSSPLPSSFSTPALGTSLSMPGAFPLPVSPASNYLPFLLPSELRTISHILPSPTGCSHQLVSPCKLPFLQL